MAEPLPTTADEERHSSWDVVTRIIERPIGEREQSREELAPDWRVPERGRRLG
jgi:hypothetical protein